MAAPVTIYTPLPKIKTEPGLAETIVVKAEPVTEPVLPSDAPNVTVRKKKCAVSPEKQAVEEEETTAKKLRRAAEQALDPRVIDSAEQECIANCHKAARNRLFEKDWYFTSRQLRDAVLEQLLQPKHGFKSVTTDCYNDKLLHIKW